MPESRGSESVRSVPLLDALLARRSRRFVQGMKSDKGPLAHTSTAPAVPLTEDEEALLAFAACGITGYALADLVYAPGEGGTIMAGLAGRTVGSGDAIHTVSVFVINDGGTYLLKRPQDFPPAEMQELVALAQQREFTELYRRMRVRIADHRIEPPKHPIYNLNVNRWSLYEPSCTYFLPVNELTLMYINGVMEIFSDDTAVYVVDERNNFRPAGVGRFAKSKGGHLHDNPADQRMATVQQIENFVSEFVSIEQGMVMQNLALTAEAMGLGGFPHWAAHAFGWLEALGFKTEIMTAPRYLGMRPLTAKLAGLFGMDEPVPLAVGLNNIEGKPLLKPFCPPNYPSMEAAVRAVVELKFGPAGVFRGGARHSAWKSPSDISNVTSPPSEAAVQATIAYCEYIYGRYGRFPAYQPPFRTVLGYQVGHVDVEFYDRYYKPEALTAAHREHMQRWH